MKIYSKLLALCVFSHGVWEAASFMVQPPSKAQRSNTALDERVMDRVGRSSYYDRPYYDRPYDRPYDIPRQGTGGPLTRWSPERGSRSWYDRRERRESDWYDREPWYRQQGMQRYDRQQYGRSSATIQGGSRESLTPDTYYGPADSVEVQLSNEGRPLKAEVQLWDGPNNTPQSLKVYSEDGYYRPFYAIFNTPGRYSNTVDVKNENTLEFPMTASVRGGGYRPVDYTWGSETVQGETLKTYSFGPHTQSVQVDLFTQGLPLQAKIELWEGPNNVKQTAEIYADDGREGAFSAIIETPAHENSIAIRNTGPTAYPIEVSLTPL